MQTSLAEVGSVEDWLSSNTKFCHLLNARIGHATCLNNKAKAQGEHWGYRKCKDCPGLDNQPKPSMQQVDKINNRKQLLASDVAEPEISALTLAYIEVLREILYGNEDLSIKVDEDFREISITDTATFEEQDGLEDELLKLFPEFSDISGVQNLRKNQVYQIAGTVSNSQNGLYKSPIRIAVYIGRCKRCGGYMVNALEGRQFGRRIDDVYRCFSCGWRTSPQYAWNRQELVRGKYL
jgi:ribosomal protein L44E